jgi:hypothetical protein
VACGLGFWTVLGCRRKSKRLDLLRHTAASAAIAAGADVKAVQQMLGHASAAMTLDVYGHLWPSRLGEVADAMESARNSALRAPNPAPPTPPGPGRRWACERMRIIAATAQWHVPKMCSKGQSGAGQQPTAQCFRWSDPYSVGVAGFEPTTSSPIRWGFGCLSGVAAGCCLALLA